MKKSISLALHVAAIAVLLVGVMLLLRDASDVLRERPYDASAPAGEKFLLASRWLPEGEEFLIAIDVPGALANPLLRERLLRLARSGGGVAAQLVGALIEDEKALGLVMLAGRLNEPGEGTQVVLMAQGNFNEESIVPAVRSAMSEGRSGVAAQDLGWSTLYSESDSRHPFGFMILDKNHMAVGERSSLMAFYESPPSPSPGDPGLADGVIFGRVSIGKRLAGSAPKMVYMPEFARIRSEDGTDLSVTLPCEDAKRAESVASFLQGLKSLITIHQGPDSAGALAGILRDVTISAVNGNAVIRSMLLPIMDLWIDDPDGVKSDLSRAGETGQEKTPLSDRPAPTAP